MFICLILGVLAAYAIARLHFKGSNLMVLVMMATQLVPPIVLVVPMYVIMRKMDLLDKHIGLIIVDISIVLPLVIWLMRGYFASIPSELEDAAVLTGVRIWEHCSG